MNEWTGSGWSPVTVFDIRSVETYGSVTRKLLLLLLSCYQTTRVRDEAKFSRCVGWSDWSHTTDAAVDEYEALMGWFLRMENRGVRRKTGLNSVVHHQFYMDCPRDWTRASEIRSRYQTF